ELIDVEQPGTYNQAIMEFGALQCLPRNPACGNCPLHLGCFAYQHKQVERLPVKLKRRVLRNRYFHYFVVREDDRVWVRKRGKADIWQHLYEFPLVETEMEMEMPVLSVHPTVIQYFGKSFTVAYRSKLYKHV